MQHLCIHLYNDGDLKFYNFNFFNFNIFTFNLFKTETVITASVLKGLNIFLQVQQIFIFSYNLFVNSSCFFFWIHRNFSCCLYFCMHHIYDVVDIGKADGICSLIFAADDFSGLFIHPCICSIYR